MLEKVKSLMKAKTAKELDAAIAAIELPKLRAAVETAQAERAARLLDGTEADVRAAEKQVAAATLAVDRGEAALAELERRLAAAQASEAEAAFRARHADAVRQRDEVVRRVREEYSVASKAILAIIEADGAATAAAKAVNDELFGDDRFGLGYIESASTVIWGKDYLGAPDLGGWTSLMPTEISPAHGRPAFEERRY